MKRNILLVSLLFAASCHTPGSNCKKDENHAYWRGKLQWLSGTWMSKSETGTFFETWKDMDDSTFSGKGRMVLTGGDTAFHEELALKIDDSSVSYIATVADQNNGRPVAFRLVNDSTDVFIFENKQHDFPQRIIYRHISPDSLLARVEGIAHDTFRSENFSMSRMKQ